MTITTVIESGDIVIRRNGPGMQPDYVLRSVPGPDQLGCATRLEAEQRAASYAWHAGVNVWFAETASTFTLLACCRPLRPRRLPALRTAAS